MASVGLKFVATEIARVLFPPTCIGCGRILADTGAVCGSCWRGLRFIEEPRCPVYGVPFSHDPGPGMVSARALAEPPDFDHARAAVHYDDLARKLVAGLKYNDRHQNADQMALWMTRAATNLLSEADALVPIPLHWQRFVARRYNQSAVLALAVSKITRVPVHTEWLQRIKRTAPQVGLSDRERQANVAGAFSVPLAQRAVVAAKRIVLIDDVLTTGATANAAARALKKAGAGQVDLVTFALVEDRVLST